MKKILIIIIFIFILYGVVKTESVFYDLPLLGRTIYLDAGHGGIDSGARYKDVLEKDINLKLALKLESELLKKGAIVYMTRSVDKDLADDNARYRKRKT